QIGDEGAYDLADTLNQNKTLTTLNLKWNQITDQGAIYLAEALCQNTTLIFLDIRFNNLSDDGKDQFLNIQNYNPRLRILL
ncbi:unnamed protein product, partial [Adineta steineri]